NRRVVGHQEACWGLAGGRRPSETDGFAAASKSVSICSKLCAQKPNLLKNLARAIKVGGSVIPSAFAALRLTINSKLVGCSIGKSAGLAPRAMRSAYSAAPGPRRAQTVPKSPCIYLQSTHRDAAVS